MKPEKITLKNGLRILVVPMPSLESATVTVWTGVGSRYEEPQIAGISHFLEHMVFKGGERFPTAKAISEAVDAMGAEFNAGTAKDWTHYYIKSRVGVVDRSFEILSDMILTPQLRKEDIERERGVIVEEMNMYEDTPMYRIGDVFEQLMYEGNTLGVDIIGNKDTVGKKISQKDFQEYRSRHYTADNMVISVSGRVTVDEVTKLAEKYFGGLAASTAPHTIQVFTSAQTAPRIKLVSKKIEQAHFIFGYQGNKLGHESSYVEDVLTTILGSGMSSRLFTEVREKRGLAYTVRMSSDHFIDTGSIGVYAGVDPGKATEALTVIKEECENLARALKSHEITAEELQKAKDYIKGHIALSLENTRSVNDYFGYEELLLKKFTTPEEDYKSIDAVTKAEVLELAAKLFKKEYSNLAIIGPFEDSAPFEKVLQSQ